MQCGLVVSYNVLGTTCQSHIQRSSSPTLLDCMVVFVVVCARDLITLCFKLYIDLC